MDSDDAGSHNGNEEGLPEEVLRMSTDELVSRTRLLDNEVKIMRSEVMRIQVRSDLRKIYLVSNVAAFCAQWCTPGRVYDVSPRARCARS